VTHLEFEISCAGSKQWFFEVDYHSNSPLALWNRYLLLLVHDVSLEVMDLLLLVRG
jgi:hypothetical protein